MWFQRSPQVLRFDRRWSTTWPARTASQAANGWLEAYPDQGAEWHAKQAFSGSSDQIARRQSGRAASLFHLLTAAGQLKTGPKSPPLFSKKWASTQANMPGLPTVTPTRTTTSTFGCAGSEVTACYGIRSTAPKKQSKFAANWRSNLT